MLTILFQTLKEDIDSKENMEKMLHALHTLLVEGFAFGLCGYYAWSITRALLAYHVRQIIRRRLAEDLALENFAVTILTSFSCKGHLDAIS